MNIQVIDDHGEELEMSRDLVKLQEKFGHQAQATFAKTHNDSEKQH